MSDTTQPINGATLKLFNEHDANINDTADYTATTDSTVSPGQGTISNLPAGDYTLAVSSSGKGTNVTNIKLPGTQGMEGLNKIINRTLLPGRASFVVQLEDKDAENITTAQGRFLISNIDAINTSAIQWTVSNAPILTQQKYRFIPADDTLFQRVQGNIDVPQSGGDNQLITIFPPIRFFVRIIHEDTSTNLNSVARVWVKRPFSTNWQQLNRASGQDFLADKGINGLWEIAYTDSQTNDQAMYVTANLSYLNSSNGDITRVYAWIDQDKEAYPYHIIQGQPRQKR